MLCSILNTSHSQGDRSLNRKLLLPVMMLLLVLSCSGGEAPVDESKDPQQRALNAKCPPTEVCGPQDSPETLVIAWLNASEHGLCSVLAKYTSPNRSDIVADYCGSTESYLINTMVVRQAAGWIGDGSNLKEVAIQGRLEFTHNGDSHTRRNWSIPIEEIGGKWFVIDGYH